MSTSPKLLSVGGHSKQTKNPVLAGLNHAKSF